MLVELCVERIALIESIRLHFDTGFNVLTGETGAGKSILLDAIGLLLGNRASADLIRKGADDAIVEALFDIRPQFDVVASILNDYGFDVIDGDLTVTRQLYRNGRTVCRINGRMATVQMLRTLGDKLVQQHGQHDHHGLLEADEQLRLLDVFGRHGVQLNDVKTAFNTYTTAVRDAKDAQVNAQERVRKLDMLAFQIEEIEQANLQMDEEEALRQERHRLQYADKIGGFLRNALESLDGSGQAAGALSLLSDATKEVAAAAAYDSSLTETHDLLDSAQISAAEAVRTMQKRASGVEADPIQLERIEDRLALLRTLQRKYGATVADILNHLKEAKTTHEVLLNYEEQLLILERRVIDAENALQQACLALHKARVEAANTLSADVRAVMQRLNMPNARFEISVHVREDGNGLYKYTEHGYDAVMFMFSANKGEDAKMLQRIASGGELSRTLLAIKAVLAAVDDVGTLIFDEIDTGVSGSAAQRIAEELQLLGGVRQVLCVTHSAQIAAAAQNHYGIEKHESATHTMTTVCRLDEGERIAEVARLLGSAVSDDTASHHAQALLQRFSSTA